MTETRNIIDYYHYWTTEAIKADLDQKRNNFSILVSNQFNDFNLGTVIRCSNAFLAKEVIIYGRKSYDRRGTVGTHLYENLRHVRWIDELVIPENSLIVGIDNLPGAVPLETFDWPADRHVVMTLGQEQLGLPEEVASICEHLVYIKQYGSVRSLNVGVAAGIAMYDYCRKVLG